MRRLSFGVIFGVACYATAAVAAFPERAVQFVTPSAPGDGLDRTIRVIATRLQEKWGQPVVVANKPGGNQTIAEGFVARATPDGYTLLILGPQPTLDAAHPSPDAGYDMVNGLAGVTQLAKQPLVLVANPKTPFKSLAEFVTYAKANPKKLNYGDNGRGSIPDLAMHRLMKATGTELFEISYKTAVPMIMGVMQGEVNVAIGTLSVLTPQIKAGNLTPLAVLDDVRTPVFPNLPTAKESLGIDSLTIRHWYGVFVASGTPKDIVAELSKSISSVVNEPEVRQLLINDGFEIVGSNPDDFQRVIKDEVAAWRTVLGTSESN